MTILLQLHGTTHTIVKEIVIVVVVIAVVNNYISIWIHSQSFNNCDKS